MQATLNINKDEINRDVLDRIELLEERLLNQNKETGFVIKYAEGEKVKANVAARYLGIRESQMEQLLDYIQPVNKHNKYLIKDLLDFKANNQQILNDLEG